AFRFKLLWSLLWMLPVAVHAQTIYVFTGGGVPDDPYLWDGADNWLNGQVAPSGSYVHILAPTLEVRRDGPNTYREIRFIEGAGAVTISGDGLTLVEAD